MLGPRSIDSRASMPPPLQRHKSTKLLITRYESLSSPIRAPLCPPEQPTASKKDKSPIRQSFRNLLAVFKKTSGLRSGKSGLEETRPFEKSLPPLLPSPAHDPSTVSTKSFPAPTLAGTLFYLSRQPEISPTKSVSLSWTFCSAVLQDESVHLTWPSTPSTHTVLLKRGVDVRSITTDELDAGEKALLPEDVKDLRIFQVGFDDRPGEKFATTSVKERARWISAIWDIILPAESTKSASCNTVTSPELLENTRPSMICSYRDLPPLPISPLSVESPTRVAVSPSIYPPTRPDSRGSLNPSRSKSPSVANLSHLSVVTQRLAQIESNRQSHSVPTSPSPLRKNPSVIRTRSLRVQIPERAETLVSPTSILDSYAIIDAVNPLLQPPDEVAASMNCPEANLSPAPTQHIPPLSTSGNADDALLQDIHRILTGVVQQTKDNHGSLDVIQHKLDSRSTTNLDGVAITRQLGDICQKLRSDLPYIMKSLADQACQKDSDGKAVEALEKLDQILVLLAEDRSQRSVQSQQQMDSVRYLNELNSWLEAFVNGGTAQIQVVAANVDRLCKELECSGEQTDSRSIFSELRQLVSNGQSRDHFEALQHSVNNLAALITSDSRAGFSSQSIAGLIEQQRQEHEGLLRALAAELSNEIRGERLRFVDAMKEATAINVQMHVEELKKELNREVRADLFAYYSKQRPPPTASVAPGQVYVHQHQTRMGPPSRGMTDPRYVQYS